MGTLGRKAVWGAALALCVLIPATSASAEDGRDKLDKYLRERTSSSQPVIISVRPEARERVKKQLPNRGRGPAEHQLTSTLTATVDARELAALAADPDVLSVSIDADVTASRASKKRTEAEAVDVQDAAIASTVTSLKKMMGLEGLFTGNGVTVAVIDSGIQNGADFTGRIAGAYDFTAGKGAILVTPSDEYGHGTHVSGLIGSTGAASSGKYAGMAPGVKFLSLKVLDRKGSGKTSNVIAALDFAVAHKNKFNVRVVNLSLGHPIYESAATDPLVRAVERAVHAGITVVVAAGNVGTNPVTGVQGYGGIASPGNAPSALTVGAAATAGTLARGDDRVATYSSRGPTWYDGFAKPDVVAPGSNMISNAADGSTLVLSYPSLVVKEGTAKFLRLNGSSMATGVVSGLVALMMEANSYGAYSRWLDYQATLRRNQQTSYPGVPALTSNAIKAILQYSATPLRDVEGAYYHPLAQGTGEVNGVGALNLAYRLNTAAPAGSFWLTSQVPPVSTFGGVDESWSQAIVWGTRLVTGSSLVEMNQPAWGDNIVWGTGELDNIVWGTVSDDGDNIVWGTMFDDDNIVWGTSLFYGNADFGDNIVWGTAMEWDDNIVWGTSLIGFFDGDNIVWGTSFEVDNIVWGTLEDDNIVWGTTANKVTVLGTSIGGGL